MLDKEDFVQNQLFEHAPSGSVWKLSTAYEGSFAATQVFPIPKRTTVQRFPWSEGVFFRAPSKSVIGKMDKAWGFQKSTT